MQLVLPEYGIHIGVTIMLLVCGFWFTFIFNIPLLAYHIWRLAVCVMSTAKGYLHIIFRYTQRPAMSGPGLYDPTEVMNRSQLQLHTREGFMKVGFYVVSFLVYLYK